VNLSRQLWQDAEGVAAADICRDRSKQILGSLSCCSSQVAGQGCRRLGTHARGHRTHVNLSRRTAWNHPSPRAAWNHQSSGTHARVHRTHVNLSRQLWQDVEDAAAAGSCRDRSKQILGSLSCCSSQTSGWERRRFGTHARGCRTHVNLHPQRGYEQGRRTGGFVLTKYFPYVKVRRISRLRRF